MEMILPILFSVLLSFYPVSADEGFGGNSPKYPPGDFRNCPQLKDLIRFEAIPGVGWDNLRNVDMGQVAFMNYSRCLMTEDGKYLILDSTYVVPIKRSQVETYGELIEHWSNYTSMTSSSINAEASYASIVSGSFSAEHQSIKMHQVNDKSITTRVMLRYHLYNIRMNPDVPLHPDFKARLLDAAAYIENNNTKMADYLFELIVRDFGTHVVTTIDAGAALAQVDQVKSTFSSNYESQKSEIKAAASASFFGKIGVKVGFSHSSSKTFSDEYLNNRTYSKVITYGGPPFRANFTLNSWEDGLNNGLVAIDRAGDPLHFIITAQNMPEVSRPVLNKVIEGLEATISRYYKFNTIRGCTSMDSNNFDFQANLDDGSCKTASTNFTFGGVYQTCEMGKLSNAGDLCSDLLQKNPLTDEYRCPDNYQAVLLNEGTVARYETSKNCNHWPWFCRPFWWEHRLSSAIYKAYWCAATGEVQEDSGFLFGGLFTKTSSNPLTKSQGCPVRFYPLRLGLHMHVCVSDDYELGYRFSIPFAGFFSCKAGNPLVYNSHLMDKPKSNGELSLSNFVHASGPSGWPRRCPTGYSQHLATIDEHCEIDYCVKANALGDQGLPNIRRPPYSPLPGVHPNQTDILFLIGPSKRIWVKNDSTQLWQRSTVEQLKQMVLHEKRDISDDTPNGGQITGITIAVFVGLLVVVAFVVWRRHGKHISLYRKQADGLVNEGSSNPYGTFEDNPNEEMDTVASLPTAHV